ncbi:unnamed protein product [Alopecurus aequalis]
MAAAAQRLLAASTKIVGVGRNYVAHAKDLRKLSVVRQDDLQPRSSRINSSYALALDMTARDLQSVAKSAGLPWTLAKAQDTFTPISAVVPKSAVPNPDDLELWLKVDDELRQKGPTSDMIFKIPFLISYISSIMTLMEGDVILTGTPEGVGPVRIGQKIKAGITGIIEAEFDVQRRNRTFSA